MGQDHGSPPHGVTTPRMTGCHQPQCQLPYTCVQRARLVIVWPAASMYFENFFRFFLGRRSRYCVL
ncbi:hypothetical protein BDN67DRAFT_970385 [Paxillus ammoniavirescens]|nr:hypothetical protein BDN67DRAFT_970385 [Paxillus ammoniavirescens]